MRLGWRIPRLTPSQGTWTLLPPAPDVCQEGAVQHDPELPHNQESVYYHYHFHFAHGRWPTWRDAMEHCSPEMRDFWTQALAEKGITV